MKSLGQSPGMIAKAATFLVFILSIFTAVPSYACFAPPPDMVEHHRELVAKTNTIVLARVAGQVNNVRQGLNRPFAKFETIELLRGETSKIFSLPNGFVEDDSDNGYEDFDQHRDAIFWDKQITRQWNAPDCQMYPRFLLGHTYLLFLDHPHWRGYEEIKEADDLWLLAVRYLLDNPTEKAGISIRLEDWLAMAQGAFLGHIVSCKGPTLSVDETLQGTFSKVWHYSNEDDDGYWPPQNCEIGQHFMVVTYRQEPSLLPYYSSSVFPVIDGKIDFEPGIDDSEINIMGPKIRTPDELRAVFLGPDN